MSVALDGFVVSLRHADNLIMGTKTGAGTPSSQEVSMFVASVALTYAAWESYVEDVAIEVVKMLAAGIRDDHVPETARAGIEKNKPTPWELLIHPGWRSLWVQIVETRAKGNQSETEFGMNTANVTQVSRLFDLVGLDFFEAIEPVDQKALNDLVVARGTVVHTASKPQRFKKRVATDYRNLVERMAVAADDSLADQAEKFLGTRPWVS